MEPELFLHFHALKKVRGSGSGASRPAKEGRAFTYWGLRLARGSRGHPSPFWGQGQGQGQGEVGKGEGGLLHIGTRTLNPPLPVALPSPFSLV